MMSTKPRAKSTTNVIGENPLEGEQLLLDALYGGKHGVRRDAAPKDKPQHYKIVSISLYNEDIARLEKLVSALKERGHYKANKSQVIRQALKQLDLDAVPKTR